MKKNKLLEVFLVSLKLGLTSFGGPVAHLGYFHHEYVTKRHWLDEHTYADLVALCQVLPGPASSQLGISIGTIRAGFWGGILAWLGFTMPSAVLLVLFAFLLKGFPLGQAGWIQGLKLVAVAIVAHAILTMWKKLITDKLLAVIALAVMTLLLFWQTVFSQVTVIFLAGSLGLIYYRNKAILRIDPIHTPLKKRISVVCIVLFLVLLIALPFLRQVTDNSWLALFDSFYRSGALVFGGGHVVLPLLETEVVPTGWLSKADFLAGYGATQAVPGPLFTFAAYLGAMIKGLPGALTALVAIFLPAYFIIIGILPFWQRIRQTSKIQGALLGINAAVIGILLAALYHPLWTAGVRSNTDIALVLGLFGLLVFSKTPPWAIVIIGSLARMFFA
jgi:chromate transporter